MKPLILHIRACNFFGGPEKQILGHITTSRNSRHTVLTFIERGGPNELLDRCKQEGIPIEAIATQNPFNPSSILKLRHVLQKIRPDVLCCHGYKPAILSLFARIGLGIPLVMFARGHTGENAKVRFFEKLERVALRYADTVVSVSRGYAEYLLKLGIVKNRIHTVHNAIQTNSVKSHTERTKLKRSELGYTTKDILIATAGRLSPEKAQNDLLAAFSIIQPKYPRTHLLILGDGPSRGELEALVHEKRRRCVHFLGFRHDINEIMSTIDLFVLPSLTEGLPNVVLEAFACEKPVVATAVGGVPDVVEDGVNGILVPPKHPELLANAMEKCLSSPKTAQAMGQAGYLKVRTEFSHEHQSRKLEKIYYDLLNP